MIETQEDLEQLIKVDGFMPFFKNCIEGFSIEEQTPPEKLFGDDFMDGPWQWKGPIISRWESAYGKFFAKKAGYVSLEWFPDFINWRRSKFPLENESEDAKRIYRVLVENESILSKQLKNASGFSLSRKKRIFDPENPTEPLINKKNGTMFDALIAQLQMGTYVCIADFEYQVSRNGETYGWGIARYCTPEAMYPELFPIENSVEGRTPEESRERMVVQIKKLFPEVSVRQFDKLI